MTTPEVARQRTARADAGTGHRWLAVEPCASLDGGTAVGFEPPRMPIRNGPHKELKARAYPRIRQLAAAVGFVVYVVAGWVLLTYLMSGRASTPAPPPLRESPSARVTVTIDVFDGPTLYCVTGADNIASDIIVVADGEVPELLRDLNCWRPGDS